MRSRSCTAGVLQGYEVVGKLLAGLTEFMEQKGYETPADFRGAVCGRIRGNDDIDRVKRTVAEIAAEKCTQCGLCARVCIYQAPIEEKKTYRIPEEACDGCGLCEQLCPAR